MDLTNQLSMGDEMEENSTTEVKKKAKKNKNKGEKDGVKERQKKVWIGEAYVLARQAHDLLRAGKVQEVREPLYGALMRLERVLAPPSRF